MYVARWILVGTVLLAAFQAWLWSNQQSLVGLVGAISAAVALIAALFLPGTRYAIALGSEWQLPRAEGESERRYRFKVALAWLLVATLCVLGCIALRVMALTGFFGIALRVFGFVAALMALQSLLVGLFRRSQGRRPFHPSANS